MKRIYQATQIANSLDESEKVGVKEKAKLLMSKVDSWPASTRTKHEPTALCHDIVHCYREAKGLFPAHD